MMRPRVVLTGASRGMGLAILRILLDKYRARVVTLSRSYTDELKEVVEKYGSDRVIAVQGDIGKSEDNVAAVKKAVEAFGGLDSLILNAGSLEPVGRLADIPQDAMLPYLQANILSTLYIVQAALPYLRSTGGRVVVVSSGASTGDYAAWGLYSMSKAAQNSLVRTLASEEKSNGVAFFAIRPGKVDTDMQRVIREKGGSSMVPEQHKAFSDLHEKGELLAPERPGAVIAGLAVQGSRDLTGQYLEWSDPALAEFQI